MRSLRARVPCLQSFAAAALLAGCASSMRPGELVPRLSRDLAEVRAAPADAHLEKDEPANLTQLRGMKLVEIQAALGTPDCGPGGPRPCFEGATLEYEFFRLPPGYLGGGRTLLVYADSLGRCTDVRWIFTE